MHMIRTGCYITLHLLKKFCPQNLFAINKLVHATKLVLTNLQVEEETHKAIQT